MGLTDADRTGEEQACAVRFQWITFHKPAGMEEGGREAAGRGRELGVVVVQGGVLGAAGDLGLQYATVRAALNTADAGLGELAAVLFDDAEAGVGADGAGVWHRLQYRRNGWE